MTKKHTSSNWSKRERCTSVYNRRGKLETLSCSGERYTDHQDETSIDYPDFACDKNDESVSTTAIVPCSKSSSQAPSAEITHRSVCEIPEPVTALAQQILDTEVTAFETRILVAQTRRTTLPPPAFIHRKLMSEG